MQRQVLHVDVAAFAVAVERVADPGLGGRPVVVAPPGGPRSLVTVVSEEARLEGIRPGMPLTRAVRRCRALVVLPPNPPLYARATHALAKLYAGYSPLVEPGASGRSYLDVTGTERLLGPARDTAMRLHRTIRNDLRLRATVGVGSNKLVSKVASEIIGRPPGVESVAAGCEERFLAPLPVTLLPGVGKRILEGLSDFNVRSVGELARIPVRHLVLGFGRVGITLSRRARGIDPTPVHPPCRRPFLREEEALASDTNDYPLLVHVLHRLVERGGRRLRRSGRVTGRLSLHLRYADSREVRGAVRLPTEADLDPLLFDAVRPLFDRLLQRRIRLRSLALVFDHLSDAPRQLTLFDSGHRPKETSLVSALDRIREKYGEGAVVKGVR
jgi:DNA polymerase-4